MTFVPSNTTAAVLYGDAPVARLLDETTANEVGLPDRLVNSIEDDADASVFVAVPTVTPLPLLSTFTLTVL